jgi:hypothetical protein
MTTRFTDERRLVSRKSVEFYAQYSFDAETFYPATGTEFSLAGLMLLTQERPERDTMFIRLALDGGSLTYEARRVWERQSEVDGEICFRSGLQFIRTLEIGE